MRQIASTQWNEHTPVSFIIPAHDEQPQIYAAVDSVLKQTHSGPISVTVVANRCADLTAACVKDYFDPQKVRVIETDQQGISLAKNLGFRREIKTNSELITFLDADCVAQPDLLQAIRLRLQNGYVGGKVKAMPLDDDRLRARLFMMIGHILNPIGMQIPGVDFGGGCCTFMTRELAGRITLEHGGVFNEGLQVMEDIDIMNRMKAQGSCAFVNETFVRTSMRRFIEEGYLKCMVQDSFHGLFPEGKTRARWQLPLNRDE